MSERPGFTHAASANLPVPHAGRWRALVIAGSMALLGGLWLAGHDHPAWGTSNASVAGILEWPARQLARIFAGLGLIIDGRSFDGTPTHLGIRVLLAVLVLALLYAWWRKMLEKLAFKPGPVDVQLLSDATARLRSAEDLTARFREELSRGSVQAPTSLPAEAPATSILDLVGDIDLSGENIPKAMSKFLGRLRPKVAYRVSGTLQRRPKVPRYGMTVTVTAYLRGQAHARTVWGDDWDQVIRDAAAWVLATLVPVTSTGRRAPWHQWWGKEMPHELFMAYQEGESARAEGDYEKARECYTKALKYDPQNPYLRTELASAFELLDRRIDAFHTYQMALKLDRRYDDGLWVRRFRPAPRWRMRYLLDPRKHWQMAAIRNRNAIMLGLSDQLADAWCVSPAPCERDIGEFLEPTLVDRYWRVALPEMKRAPGWTRRREERMSRDRFVEVLRGRDKPWLRVYLQRACLQETDRLAADDRRARIASLTWWPWMARFLGRPRPPESSTLAALRVNREVWAPLRLSWAESRVHDRRPAGRCGYACDRRRRVRYDAGSAALSRRVDHALTGKPVVRHLSRSWQEHYNAACVFAFVLLARRGRAHPDPAGKFTELAIDHLERAVIAARQGDMKLLHEWLVEQDPDLDELRDKTRFKVFLKSTYPAE